MGVILKHTLLYVAFLRLLLVLPKLASMVAIDFSLGFVCFPTISFGFYIVVIVVLSMDVLTPVTRD